MRSRRLLREERSKFEPGRKTYEDNLGLRRERHMKITFEALIHGGNCSEPYGRPGHCTCSM